MALRLEGENGIGGTQGVGGVASGKGHQGQQHTGVRGIAVGGALSTGSAGAGSLWCCCQVRHTVVESLVVLHMCAAVVHACVYVCLLAHMYAYCCRPAGQEPSLISKLVRDDPLSAPWMRQAVLTHTHPVRACAVACFDGAGTSVYV